MEKSFESALNSAVPSADYFDQRDLVVTAGGNSVLGRCVAALPATFQRDHHSKVCPETFVNFLAANAMAPNEGTGFSEFQARITESAEVAARAVTTELFQARTIVKPIVEELTSRMCEQMEMIGKNPITDVEIVRRRIPAPLKHPSLIASIKRASDIVTSTKRPNLRLPSLSASEILPLMRTGAGELDKAIEEHFASKPEGWLETAWTNIYTERSASGMDLQAVMFGRNNIDIALFVFLTARRMWDNPLPETNMAAGSYSEAMVFLRDQAAKILLAEVSTLANEEKAGILIYSVTGTRVEVWEDTYRDWLASGGKNEVLLGMLISGENKSTIADINSNAQEYINAWTRHEGINSAAFANNRLLRVRDALRLEMQHITMNSSEEEFPTATRAAAMATFNRMANEINYSDLECMPMTCMRLVCRSRFPGRNFEAILESLQRQIDENDELSIQEAVEVVTQEHVARWVATQMTLVAPGSVVDHF